MKDFRGIVRRKNEENSPYYLTEWYPSYADALIAGVRAGHKVFGVDHDIEIERRVAGEKTTTIQKLGG